VQKQVPPNVVSLPWMAVITVLTCAQKLLPVKAALDVPPALAIIGLGIWIILEPLAGARAHPTAVIRHRRRGPGPAITTRKEGQKR
jgi:hypothetical protein